jgi:hypothetical protein
VGSYHLAGAQHCGAVEDAAVYAESTGGRTFEQEGFIDCSALGQWPAPHG